MAIQFKDSAEAHAWLLAMGGGVQRGFGHTPEEIVAAGAKIADAVLLEFRSRRAPPEEPELPAALAPPPAPPAPPAPEGGSDGKPPEKIAEKSAKASK